MDRNGIGKKRSPGAAGQRFSAAGSAATTTSRGGEAHARMIGNNEFRVTHDDPSFFAAVRHRTTGQYGRVKRLDV